MNFKNIKIKNLHQKTEILNTKNKYKDNLFKKYKLNGIGVGLKKVDGKFTDELVVVLMVKKKLPKDQIPKDQLLPSTLDNLSTDVVETGIVRALDVSISPSVSPSVSISPEAEEMLVPLSHSVYKTKVRPAAPGYSVGHPSVTAGTFGCVVYKGADRFVLSNNHILANRNLGVIGDPIYQPGVYDGGTSADTIAYLDSFVTLQNNVNVDAAIAEVTNSTLVTDTGAWGGAIDSWLDPVIGNTVSKTGRTSGNTFALVTYEHTDINVAYGGSVGTITVTDCFVTETQALGGDSGSCGRLTDTCAAGLVFASGGIGTIFSYMSNIVTALGLDLTESSPSPSRSPSISPSVSPTSLTLPEYSRGKYTLATLPATPIRLTTDFIEQDYTDVAAHEGTMVSQIGDATNIFSVFSFRLQGIADTKTISYTWIGQSTIDCTETWPVQLLIYNHTNEAWELLSGCSNSSILANNDITLTGQTPASGGSVSDYYSVGDLVVSFLLVANVGTGTLKTDLFSCNLQASLSPSISPSISLSPSLSPSISPSISPSLSPSISPSVSISPSRSPSISPSISPSPSPGWKNYTKGDYLPLPTNNDDLENAYTVQEVIDVSTDNGVRVCQNGTLKNMVHEFKNYVGTEASCRLNWNGQSSLAPSSSTVYLQIWNINTLTWDTVANNNTADEDTDFSFYTVINDLTNYKTASQMISCRIYQLAL